ncbi:Trs120-domain-containing protein [Ascodesmis nigricans]|uniref:Trs120-domain-containing protein n=1 Tax=Ascodesmis nigricans TaxID=341454 RepID=A0A4S2N6K1_9PEZI|nr:Trs120-domain-containing protein [Ascodesmis nigricans]
MPLDSLSFTAPARLRALVCPLGRIRRSRYSAFSEQLSSGYEIRLGDVTPDAQRPLFSPQGFPDGRITYDFTTALSREHEYIENFELHRRTFVVIAIADYKEENDPEKLAKQLEELRFLYPRALHHVCLLFDAPPNAPEQDSWPKPKNAHNNHPSFIPVPPKTGSRSALRTTICDITAAVLSEMHSLAKSFQEAGTIDSPLAHNPRPGSREHRMSLPVGGLDVPTGQAKKRTTMIATGSGTASPVGERGKGKGSARVQIAIAQLHLLSGRTPDALREFIEGAEICKATSDHLWHGKALEGIGVCCVIMAHLQVPFQIPLIPYPLPEGASKSSKTSSPAPQGPIMSSTETDHASLCDQILALIPEINNAITTLYLRASAIPTEKIPHLCYCETILRHSKALTSQYLASGNGPIAIRHMTTGTGVSEKMKPAINGPFKVEIANSVMRAYPHNIESFTVLEATRILSGIASVLGAVGMQRRKGLVTRELLKILIPGLIQARVVGAAEVGVHPAAGLSALSAGPHGSPLDLGEDDVESGVIELLEDVCRAYGVLPGIPPAGEPLVLDGVPAATRSVIAEQEIRSFGWPALKIHVLRNCASLCEALPDFEGVLKFTTQLLRMADEQLTKEEQVRLSTTISRTVAAARKLGLEDVEADYWDQFLLRDVELVENGAWRSPVAHTGEELFDLEVDADYETPRNSTQAVKIDKTPFIYNPTKKAEASGPQLFMVAGEAAEFKVTLQNPFEFEVEVESVTLDAEGVELDVHGAGVIIPHYRTCQVSVSATPKTTGEIKITGCRIKVYGCKELLFPIFCEGLDARDRDTKTKRFGLRASEPKVDRPLSTISQNRQSQRPPPVLHPIPKSLSLNVVDAQPLLVVKHTSLSQSALMILEGEKMTFNMTLQNLSSVDVDLLVFNFTDSTTARIQQALIEKGSSPAERYELELMLERKKAFYWKRQKPSTLSDSGRRIYVPAHGTATFTIGALGKPGLTNGVIEANYSHLGKPRSSFSPDMRFFTRQLQYPITVTVNASTELARVDILPFTTGVSVNTADGIQTFGAFKKLFEKETLKNPSDYCILLLDLRNAWPQPLRVTLDISDTPFAELAKLSNDDGKEDGIYSTTEIIQAGHTTRFILPLHRIFLDNPISPIPSLTTSQRQFVVSTAKISLTAERQARESFWFREALLSRLRGRWEEVGKGATRSGEVELRGVRLSQRMVETIRIEEVGVNVEIVPDSEGASSDDDDDEEEEEFEDAHKKTDIDTDTPTFQRLSPTLYLIPTSTFSTLTTTITNRTSRPLHLLLRLSITLKSQSLATALDLGRRLAINGVPQQSIGLVQPGEARVVETGMVGLSRGEWEVLASVEVVRDGRVGREEGRERGEKGEVGLETGGVGMDERGALVDILRDGAEGRWCWVAREVVGVRVV